jgi:transcriptional regulator with XRE-family HTH domain
MKHLVLKWNRRLDLRMKKRDGQEKSHAKRKQASPGVSSPNAALPPATAVPYPEVGIEVKFKERLRKTRTACGLTQGKLAARVGVERETITGYETTSREPNYENLAKIVTILGTSADYLLGLIDKPDAGAAFERMLSYDATGGDERDIERRRLLSDLAHHVDHIFSPADLEMLVSFAQRLAEKPSPENGALYDAPRQNDKRR